ncbi:energy-coupling factor transport system ATP-binding protein [Desulfobaculum xiamenense]|uniref:Energy-coupling factor transport system ATP-binding protein n=1 Tax=Desulfobaculum xiamenense TaxID=995050 RepID=A0A846QK56_9BACT|nr:ABC transporter ATP-binding protein [Desulfobaculum xiamenense]NJB66563.1 energy-coupling factor transport system ATP-binding protein [Desulfobaculum xiamenense]
MIDAHDLHFTTADTHAHVLRGVSLNVRRGERIALVGPSGAGKTTLGYHLCAIHKRALCGTSTGRLTISGQDCLDRDLPGFCGVVLQNPDSQLFCDTVEEEIALGPENMGKSPREVHHITERMLEVMGLSPYRHQRIHTLSHGLRQRLSIAGMLAIGPEVLFLDEPTNFLDNGSADALFTTLAERCASHGLTVIVVEHDLTRAMRFASRVVPMQDGRIVPADVITPLPSCPRPRTVLPGPVLLQADGLRFGWEPSRPVLENASLTLRAGEIVALTGDNGTGKTTLLRLLKGLSKPQAGRVATADSSPLMERVGLVFQNPDEQIFAHSVHAECGYALRNAKVPAPEADRRVREALALMRIDTLAERLPFTLSYGEKRRLSLASVLVTSPDILCLDEPTVALDRRNLDILRETLLDLRDAGTAILIATHDHAFAASVADRTLVIRDRHLEHDAQSDRSRTTPHAECEAAHAHA